ncbi:hypothetical protein QBC35DRAFT_443270 [Podospora australis]|uniref:Enoyl reductase (ER) domain-containing protein n=1 Tax=Podospora australis TaxID=1536484 RepID=A0AAN6WLD3_9PEZI|nr:hypothetical protein QBC35DRAFT_443270 [Podospora australis]
MATTLPKTMRAWRYHSFAAGPRLEQNLKIEDSLPVPTLGRNHALVKVLSVSLNPADYKAPELPGPIRRIAYSLPATPGCDFCGRVVQLSADSAAVKVGDLVFGRVLPGRGSVIGTLAEYISVPAAAVAKVPQTGLSVDEAAAMGVVGNTAWQAIYPHIPDTPNTKVFINGGSGGTGTFSIGIAKALGCHVTVSCSTEKVDLCKSLGADEVIDYKTQNVIQVLKSKGPTFFLVVDNVGSPLELYKASDDFLLPGGKFVQVGGPMSLGSVKTVLSNLFWPKLLGGGKHKFQVLMIAGYQPDQLTKIAEWIAEKKMRVVIEEPTYEFEEAVEAFTKLRQGRNKGKLVIHVAKE